MAEPKASTDALLDRVMGRSRTGTVNLRSFDEGVVETMGATVSGDRYFITALSDVDPAPDFPGVPVHFATGEDVFQTYRIPVIVVRRDDISPAANRWHPVTGQYHVPAYGSLKVGSQLSGDTRVSFDRWEDQYQAFPFDILYTINVIARQRSSRAAANRIFDYILRIYQPYSAVLVKDSLGDVRSYEAFMEAVAPKDSVPEIGERVIGFAISLRVEAELDINDPVISKAVTKPVLRMLQTGTRVIR